MPINIRPRGIGLVIVAILLFALAAFTRVGWLLLFDAVLWGMILVSAIMPWLSIGDLRIHRRVSNWQGRGEFPGPMEGNEVDLDLVLENRGLLPCIFVSVGYNYRKSHIESAKQGLFMTWLNRKGQYTNTTKLTFNRRGLHALPSLKAETSVPFGIFRRSKRLNDSTEVLILPKIYPVSNMELLDDSGTTSVYSVRARAGDQVTGSRGYVSGDPSNHIHWRNSARLSEPQVKEFERTPDSALVIAFDISRSEKDSESLEQAVRIAASACDYVCRAGGIVRLKTSQLNEETNNRQYLLRTLALMKGPQEARFPALSSAVPPFSAVLTIVQDTDTIGLRETARLAAAQRKVTAVVLRGHDKKNVPSNPTAELSKAGVNVIECWPGEEARAISLLGQETSSTKEGMKAQVG